MTAFQEFIRAFSLFVTFLVVIPTGVFTAGVVARYYKRREGDR